MNNDPYYIVKNTISETLAGLRELHKTWRLHLADTSPAADDEFSWTTEELRNAIKTVEWDLQELKKTIQIVQQNKTRFNIDEHELANRRRFVQESEDFVANLKIEIDTGVRQRVRVDPKSASSKHSQTSSSKRYEKVDNLIEKENEDYIQTQARKQDDLYAQQHKDLEELEVYVDTLHGMSQEMGQELEAHDKALTHLETETDRSNSGVRKAVGQINQLLDKADGNTGYIIVLVLTLVLIGLIVLILFI